MDANQKGGLAPILWWKAFWWGKIKSHQAVSFAHQAPTTFHRPAKNIPFLPGGSWWKGGRGVCPPPNLSSRALRRRTIWHPENLAHWSPCKPAILAFSPTKLRVPPQRGQCPGGQSHVHLHRRRLSRPRRGGWLIQKVHDCSCTLLYCNFPKSSCFVRSDIN